MGAIATGVGLFTLGPAGNFLAWPPRSDDECFRWSSTDELRKLIRFLSAGRPISLGLIEQGGFGHEVAAFGLETDIDLPPGF